MTRNSWLIQVAAICAILQVGGCGDGAIDAVVATKASALSAPPVSVRLEGCVVNAQWTGAAATAVQVRPADGRALATAFTDRLGVFVVDVPARTTIVLDTAAAGPGALSVLTGSTSFSMAGCLLADQ